MNRIASRLGFKDVQDLRQASKIYQVFGTAVPRREISMLRQRSQSLAIDMQLEKWKSDQSNRSSVITSKVRKLFDLSQVVDETDVDQLASAARKAKQNL